MKQPRDYAQDADTERVIQDAGRFERRVSAALFLLAGIALGCLVALVVLV